jgi:DNA repair protein RecN (Recombination protein N)
LLIELTVRNFAVIEETRLALGPGLNVVTGETGAGKSLLVDALELVLGGRGDREVVRTGEQAAYVEAVFQTDDNRLSGVLQEHGLQVENDGALVLTRETNREGRSVSRINGRTVPVSVVRAVGELLVDIHGQGTHLSLLGPAFQLQMLDAYGSLGDLRNTVAESVARIRRLEAELATLDTDARLAEQRRDLLAFQVDEIDAAELQPGEEESLVQERELLLNAQVIQEACATAHDAIYAGSSNAADLLASARQALSRVPDPTGDLTRFLNTLESASAQVEEVARDVRAYGEFVEREPGRLEHVDDRLEFVRRLKRKYGDTIEAVIAFGEQAQHDLGAIEHATERRDELQQDLKKAYTQAGTQAWELSERRHDAAGGLERDVTGELAGVGLERVQFSCGLARKSDPSGLPAPDGPRYAFSETGIDQGEFLVATNPGEGLKALARVASGGETSRLMLAIKGALRSASVVPTLVFDEIDSGIGGRVGEVVGRKLWSLGAQNQVLCVTHLPQIAAYADSHFRVDKAVLMGRTYAQALPVDGDVRVEELAAMLGGAPSPQLDAAARQLVQRAKDHKQAGLKAS